MIRISVSALVAKLTFTGNLAVFVTEGNTDAHFVKERTTKHYSTVDVESIPVELIDVPEGRFPISGHKGRVVNLSWLVVDSDFSQGFKAFFWCAVDRDDLDSATIDEISNQYIVISSHAKILDSFLRSDNIIRFLRLYFNIEVMPEDLEPYYFLAKKVFAFNSIKRARAPSVPALNEEIIFRNNNLDIGFKNCILDSLRQKGLQGDLDKIIEEIERWILNNVGDYRLYMNDHVFLRLLMIKFGDRIRRAGFNLLSLERTFRAFCVDIVTPDCLFHRCMAPHFPEGSQTAGRGARDRPSV